MNRVRLSAVAALLVSLGTAAADSALDEEWLAKPCRVSLILPANIPGRAVVGLVADELGPSCVVGEDLPDADKHLHVTLSRDSGSTRIEAYEDDVWLHETGPVWRRTVDAPSLVLPAVAEAAASSFRPRVILTSGDNGIRGTVWGGKLAPPPGVVREGDLLRPLLRFTDRDGEWKETKPIAWTYLRVTESGPFDLSLDPISAFGQPLPGRIRRGVIIGLKERPPLATSTVQVIGDTDRTPRAGLRVSVRPGQKPDMDGETEQPPLFTDLSDREGRIELPLLEQDVVWISVRSTTSLANVPIRPGHLPHVLLPVAEDRDRVALDERLDAIELALTDLAARKAVHLARVKQASKAKEWNKVDLSLEALDMLPPADSLLIDLNAARVEAVAAAQDRGDRAQAARLKRQADRLETTIENFVDPTADAEFRAELKALKEVDEATKKVEAEAQQEAEGG